ncbi:hypothetical protein ACH4TE_35075 [Streptomyces sioyaensis]|uniref:hypothetical protein n=1 Tax=Streptomyces sioyaensis TaxID=67364 RepID=UPI003798C2A3
MTTEELANALREHLADYPLAAVEGADEILDDSSTIGIRCADGTLLFVEVQAI